MKDAQFYRLGGIVVATGVVLGLLLADARRRDHLAAAGVSGPSAVASGRSGATTDAGVDTSGGQVPTTALDSPATRTDEPPVPTQDPPPMRGPINMDSAPSANGGAVAPSDPSSTAAQ